MELDIKNLVVRNLVKYGNYDLMDLSLVLKDTEYEMPVEEYKRLEAKTRKEMNDELKWQYLAEYKKLLIAYYKGDKEAKGKADNYAREIKKL